ncbi:MAG TPA: type II secretion system protein N [Allosphingosinicella sp.]|nr:type II secretion system protein N [Allosphingosinicella sp.]
MRVRLPLGRGLFFVCAFLFALIALLPLRLALDPLGLGEHGVAAREATGSVWLGTMREAQLGRIALGDLAVGLETLPLLAGRARVSAQGLGDTPFKGAFNSTRHGFGVDDVTAQLRMAGTLGPLPLGVFDTTDLSVHFADGLCRTAEGRVRAAAAGDIGGFPLPGLSGTARCDGGVLLLALASDAGTETLQLRIGANGRYRAELGVRPSQPELAPALTAAGFVQAGGGYSLRLAGAF